MICYTTVHIQIRHKLLCFIANDLSEHAGMNRILYLMNGLCGVVHDNDDMVT